MQCQKVEKIKIDRRLPQKIKEKARTPQGSNWKKEGMWDFALEDDDL